MLNFLYEFLPVLLFFIAFKFYGIYTATVVGITATGLQFIFSTLWTRKIDKKQLMVFLVFLFFGSLTLHFHNPIFVKWKPTVVFWIFAAVLLISQFIGKKPIIQRMCENVVAQKELPRLVWSRLNFAWVVFFATLGAINIFIAYNYSDETWVNFKFYGIMGLLFVFSIFQALYLVRYMSDAK